MGAWVALLLTSCVDTRQKLEDFQERYERTHEGRLGGGGNACPSEFPRAEELAGSFLVSVSPAFSPKKPIVFTASVQAAASGSQLRFSFDLQPLSATDRRTPVGGSVGRAETSAGAEPFQLDFGQVTVPGEADPILPGRPIVAMLTLSGQLCGPDPATGSVDFSCGTADGSVSEPTSLSLTGSTWTARRIKGPGTLPDIAINCALEPPDPL
ncbi:MAG TPA: hypothetical protein VK524_02950 [Polyangiaceae bacterium]|nr:hypothetical protein [Polyangiaceae bacterium]